MIVRIRNFNGLMKWFIRLILKLKLFLTPKERHLEKYFWSKLSSLCGNLRSKNKYKKGNAQIKDCKR